MKTFQKDFKNIVRYEHILNSNQIKSKTKLDQYSDLIFSMKSVYTIILQLSDLQTLLDKSKIITFIF